MISLAPGTDVIRGPKDHVVTWRVDDSAPNAIDAVVEAGIGSTRSDATAWPIGSGIEANREFFAQVYSTVAEIRRLRDQAQALARLCISAKVTGHLRPSYTPARAGHKPRLEAASAAADCLSAPRYQRRYPPGQLGHARQVAVVSAPAERAERDTSRYPSGGRQVHPLSRPLPGLVGPHGSLLFMRAHGASSLEGGQPGRGGLAAWTARAMGQQRLHHGLIERARSGRQRGFARRAWGSRGLSITSESSLPGQHSVLEHKF